MYCLIIAKNFILSPGSFYLPSLGIQEMQGIQTRRTGGPYGCLALSTIKYYRLVVSSGTEREPFSFLLNQNVTKRRGFPERNIIFEMQGHMSQWGELEFFAVIHRFGLGNLYLCALSDHGRYYS